MGVPGRLIRAARAAPTLESCQLDLDAVRAALGRVNDPEIRRPITELGMVKDVNGATARSSGRRLLTVAGCPMRDTHHPDVTARRRRRRGRRRRSRSCSTS